MIWPLLFGVATARADVNLLDKKLRVFYAPGQVSYARARLEPRESFRGLQTIVRLLAAVHAHPGEGWRNLELLDWAAVLALPARDESQPILRDHVLRLVESLRGRYRVAGRARAALDEVADTLRPWTEADLRRLVGLAALDPAAVTRVQTAAGEAADLWWAVADEVRELGSSEFHLKYLLIRSGYADADEIALTLRRLALLLGERGKLAALPREDARRRTLALLLDLYHAGYPVVRLAVDLAFRKVAHADDRRFLVSFIRDRLIDPGTRGAAGTNVIELSCYRDLDK